MKTKRWSVDPTNPDKSILHYGVGLVNTLSYLLKGFRGWQCFGIVVNNSEYEFGVEIEGKDIVAVYGTRFSNQEEADDPKELEQIQEGKTAVVLFLGDDNTSYMRRMTPEEYDDLAITFYEHRPTDLFYNS